MIAATMLVALLLLLAAPARALQCVPFAREQSGISLQGDAWTWWTAAAGQYDRGQAPRPGAVVVFKKHGSMNHGHVAVVAKVINSRRVLVDHANWAPHRSHDRGQVAKLVVVVDLSPHNDWTVVRVWNDSSGELGTKLYPTYGFIYPRAGHLKQAIAVAVAAGADDDAAQPLTAPALTAFAGDSGVSADPAASQSPALSAVGAVASLTNLLAPPQAAMGFAIESSLAQ